MFCSSPSTHDQNTISRMVEHELNEVVIYTDASWEAYTSVYCM